MYPKCCMTLLLAVGLCLQTACGTAFFGDEPPRIHMEAKPKGKLTLGATEKLTITCTADGWGLSKMSMERFDGASWRAVIVKDSKQVEWMNKPSYVDGSGGVYDYDAVLEVTLENPTHMDSGDYVCFLEYVESEMSERPGEINGVLEIHQVKFKWPEHNIDLKIEPSGKLVEGETEKVTITCDGLASLGFVATEIFMGGMDWSATIKKDGSGLVWHNQPPRVEAAGSLDGAVANMTVTLNKPTAQDSMGIFCMFDCAIYKDGVYMFDYPMGYMKEVKIEKPEITTA